MQESHAPTDGWASTGNSSWFDRGLSLVPLGLTLLVYYPLTRNYFRTDDFLYLYRIVNSDLWAYLIEPHGGHLLMARNLVFYLCYQVFGLWSAGFFWTVLLTHLLNVFLLFRAIHRFTGSRHLACFGAALWGTSPLQEGSLGWYSVYGHVMVGSVVCFLLSWAPQPRTKDRSAIRTGLLWAILLVVAATSFGVGLGLVMAMPLAASFLIRDPHRRRSVVVSSLLVACAVPFLYISLAARYAADRVESTPLWMSGLYQPFKVAAFLLQLIGNGASGLLLGPFRLYVESPAVSYSFAALVLLAALAALVAGRSNDRKPLAGCLLICAACYGAIAFGLASRTVFFGLVFADSIRYQYVGSIGLLVALCLVANQVAHRWPLLIAQRNGFLAAAFAWIGVQIAFGEPIDHHEEVRRHTSVAISRMQQVIERAPAATDVFIENRRFPGVGPFLFTATERFPGWAGLFVIEFPDNVVDGKRVFFVTNDQRALAAAEEGKRTAGLLLDRERARQRGWRPPN